MANGNIVSSRTATADDRDVVRRSSCCLHRSSRVRCTVYVDVHKKQKTCVRCAYLHYTRTVRASVSVRATRTNTPPPPGRGARKPYSRWPHWLHAVTNTDHDGPLGISIVIPCDAALLPVFPHRRQSIPNSHYDCPTKTNAAHLWYASRFSRIISYFQ